MTLDQVRADLRAVADPERAARAQRYFRTGPGEYGEGDVFLGVTMPQARAVARRHAGLDLDALAQLLASPVHEERMVALLVLLRRYQRGGEAERRRIHELYLASTAHVNNWDLVDVSAPGIVGAHLLERPRDVLNRLADSASLWERRIAVLATFAFIRAGDCDDSLRLAERLLGDRHDLIHKATGWMLREVGKRDPARLLAFLERHRAAMPRTMLRYAIERLDPAERARLLAR